MEAYDDNETLNDKYQDASVQFATSIYNKYDGVKSFFTAFLGVFIALIGIVLVFFVSSLKGTKEIKASNKENAQLIEIWRSRYQTDFPEEKVDLISYNGEMYYFVQVRDKEGKVVDWYFAYDGGIDYVLKSPTFYILTALTIVVSVVVSQINYTTAINASMNSTRFLKTLRVYQKQKEKVSNDTQYLSEFCRYKNKQAYEDMKRSIVESADISYSYYNSKDFDYDSLADWQKKKLNKIKKIKVKNITPSDLLQEGKVKSLRVRLLPLSPEESKRNFLVYRVIRLTISSFLSGLTMIFSFVLGEWILGITYASTVISSFIVANVMGTDYANNTLRQRYIAKSDLLNEFYNIKEDFILEHKQVELKDDTKTNSIFGDVEGLKNKQEENIDNPSKTLIRDNENYNNLLHEEVKANG